MHGHVDACVIFGRRQHGTVVYQLELPAATWSSSSTIYISSIKIHAGDHLAADLQNRTMMITFTITIKYRRSQYCFALVFKLSLMFLGDSSDVISTY